MNIANDPYFALAVKAYRVERKKGVTMKKIAKILGVGEKTVSKIVNTTASKPAKPVH